MPTDITFSWIFLPQVNTCLLNTVYPYRSFEKAPKESNGVNKIISKQDNVAFIRGANVKKPSSMYKKTKLGKKYLVIVK